MHSFIPIVCAVLSVMAESVGAVDLASLQNQVTRLEQTLSSFQTKTTQLETALQRTETDLQSTKAELEEAKSNFNKYRQSSSADIISMKTELEVLKKAQGSSPNNATSLTTLSKNIATLTTKSNDNAQSLSQLTKTLASSTSSVSFHVSRYTAGKTGINTPVAFHLVNHNTGNGYNTTSDKFKAPVAGTYNFLAEIELYQHHVPQSAYISIVKSGSILQGNAGGKTAQRDDLVLIVTTITHVKKGEEVWVMSDTDVYMSHAHFDGKLLF